MFVAEDLGWIVLTTILFIVFHVLFERALRLKQIVSWNLRYWNLEMISGIYYSVISLGIELIIYNFSRSYTIPTGILISFALVTLRSELATVINILPSMIFHILQHQITLLTYLIYGVMFLAMITYSISKEFSKDARYPKIIMGTVLTVVSFVIYFIFLSKSFEVRSLYEATLVLALLGLIILIAVSYFISFSKSANILSDSITYTYLNYYRLVMGMLAIQSIIKKKHISRGLFIAFKHNFLEQQLPIEVQKKLSLKFLASFEKQVPKDSVLLFMEENTHGIFIPDYPFANTSKSLAGNLLATREKDDSLKDIEKLFSRFERTYETEEGFASGIRIRVGVSVYGIQDSSLSQLESNATFALNSFNSQSENIVSLFDPLKFKEVVVDSKKLLDLDQALKLDNFENRFKGIYSSEKNEWIGVLSSIDNNSEFNWSHSIRDHVKFNYWTSEFDRYFAISTLTEFASNPIGKVMFHYSPILNNKSLNFDVIKNKMNQLGVKPNQVIFVLDDEPDEKWKLENIENAKAAGFEIALQDIANKKIIEKVDPAWVILSPINFKEAVNLNIKRIIFDEINSLEKLRVAKSFGAKFFAGELLQEEKALKDFDISSKKSRIYLKQLITETFEEAKNE